MTSTVALQPIESEWITSQHNSPWNTVNAWIDLVPTIFITLGGWIQFGAEPVAFRLTAMVEDSLARRLVRLACSLLIAGLIAARYRGVLRVCRKERWLLGLPVIAFISAIWSQNPQHTVIDATNLGLTSLFAVYLFLRYPGKQLLMFLLFPSALLLLLGLATVIIAPSIGIDSFQQNAWRGVFGQRNNCATACVLFFLLALHVHARSFIEHCLRGSVIVLAGLFIVMSYSRAGWIVGALAVMFSFALWFIQRMHSLDRIVFLMLLTIPIGLIGFAIENNFAEITEAMGKDPTLTQRTVIWSEVLPSIMKRPIQGHGYSAFWMGLKGESARMVLATHWMEGQAQDGYLDILLQLGLLGFLPALWMLGRGIALAWGAVKSWTTPPHVSFAAILLPIVMIQNIGESSLLLPFGVPWLYMLLAFLILSHSKKGVDVI